MEQSDDLYLEYPVFKGLQWPLEFLGFQGRYIYWAAGTAGGGVAGFIVGYLIFGFVLGLILLTVIFAFGSVMTFLKQRKGLHSKDCSKGIYIFARSRRALT